MPYEASALSFLEPIEVLMNEILWEFVVALESDFYGSAIFRNVVCLEDIIPQTQANAIIHAILAFWQHISMMVQVHHRIVENNATQRKFLTGWLRRAESFRA